MPRLTRTQTTVPTAPHHVILRGNNRRRLFSFPHDYRFFVQQLARAQARTEIELNACCVMTNHVHLLVTPNDVGQLSLFVKRVAQAYAAYRNVQFGSSGKLFESRFIALPILSERQLAIITAYIDLNPMRAGMVSDAGAYRWSTYGMHAATRDASASLAGVRFTPSVWYAGLGRDAASRAREYRAFIDECIARDRVEFEAEARGSARADEKEVPSMRRPNGTRAAGLPRENVSNSRGQSAFAKWRLQK